MRTMWTGAALTVLPLLVTAAACVAIAIETFQIMRCQQEIESYQRFQAEKAAGIPAPRVPAKIEPQLSRIS